MAPEYDRAVDDSIGKSLRPAWGWLGREKSLGRVVEFGCGTGYFTASLARASESVVATTFRMNALPCCRSPEGRPERDAAEPGLHEALLPDGAFDTVFMSLVLNLTDDPAQALDQAHRVLKPGGTLFVAIPDWGMHGQDDPEFNAYRIKSNYEAAAEYPITGNNLAEKNLEQS